MGEHDVDEELEERSARAFQRALLDDLAALERMVEGGLLERGVARIGAEQEMFLVGADGRPARAALDVLSHAKDPRLTTELALFNLEANLTPRPFGGSCLADLERELEDVVGVARAAAAAVGVDVVLTGSLPTLRLEDLSIDAMTPVPRYHALARVIRRMRGDAFRVHVDGDDVVDVVHDNVLLESCATSFQLHWQVAPEDFARDYNVAQLVVAPLLAASANSPILLGKRSWAESRIALFERSMDMRADVHRARDVPARVFFGNRWVERSVVELFRENIEHHRVLLTADLPSESAPASLDAGRLPTLDALRLHNGTVYRWNRPCYGVAGGAAHLRIEVRPLPAGPSVIDEVASAALLYGLLSVGREVWADLSARMPFELVRQNFFAAAQRGLDAELAWVGGERRPAADLLLRTLLPLAERGLAAAGVDASDASRLLRVVERRVAAGITGASWARRSLASMGDAGSRDERMRRIVRATVENQRGGSPVAQWPTAPAPLGKSPPRTVGEVMTRRLFTVRPEDLIDLAQTFMQWENVRHVPVEDDHGRLAGMITQAALLAALLEPGREPSRAVREIMQPVLVALEAHVPVREAIALARRHRVSAIPIVEGDRLVGLVTERDLLYAADDLLAAGEPSDAER